MFESFLHVINCLYVNTTLSYLFLWLNSSYSHSRCLCHVTCDDVCSKSGLRSERCWSSVFHGLWIRKQFVQFDMLANFCEKWCNTLVSYNDVVRLYVHIHWSCAFYIWSLPSSATSKAFSRQYVTRMLPLSSSPDTVRFARAGLFVTYVLSICRKDNTNSKVI